MGFNGTGNHTVRIREDGIDSLIQIGEGLFRIIRPEQVAAHPVAMGAVNHLFCTGCFEKLELPAAVPDRPIHDLQGIPSSCGNRPPAGAKSGKNRTIPPLSFRLSVMIGVRWAFPAPTSRGDRRGYTTPVPFL